MEDLNTALEAVKPGAGCEEVEPAWRKIIATTGMEKEFRSGQTIDAHT